MDELFLVTRLSAKDKPYLFGTRYPPKKDHEFIKVIASAANFARAFGHSQIIIQLFDSGKPDNMQAYFRRIFEALSIENNEFTLEFDRISDKDDWLLKVLLSE